MNSPVAKRDSHSTRPFGLTATDYAEYSVFASTRSRFSRRLERAVLAFLIGPIAVLLDVVLGLHPDLYDKALGASGFVALAVVLGTATLTLSTLARPWIIRFSAHRRFRDGTFYAYRENQSIEICTDGVRCISGQANSFTPWSSVVAIEATRTAIYIFLNSLGALIAPRRAFGTAAEFDVFLKTARELRKSSY